MKPQNFKNMAKGKGNKVMLAPPVTVEDLTLTLSGDGSTLETTISPMAQWAGIQKYIDPVLNDGAISIGNWMYWTPGQTDGTESAPAFGTGYYRSWSTDFGTYDVHRSNVVHIP